jgi:hypothetical protein
VLRGEADALAPAGGGVAGRPGPQRASSETGVACAMGRAGHEERCESRVCPRVRLEAMGCDTHLGTVSSPGPRHREFGLRVAEMVHLESGWWPYGTQAVWAGRRKSSIVVCVLLGLRTESRDQQDRRGQRNGLGGLGGLGCCRRMDRKFPSARRRTNAGTETVGRRSRRCPRRWPGDAARHGFGCHLSQRGRLASRAWWRHQALGDPKRPH